MLYEVITEYPMTQLVCSGESVGLPLGIMGNSEVGHLNIGAGRIVYQDLLRIDMAIRDGDFVITSYSIHYTKLYESSFDHSRKCRKQSFQAIAFLRWYGTLRDETG